MGQVAEFFSRSNFNAILTSIGPIGMILRGQRLFPQRLGIHGHGGGRGWWLTTPTPIPMGQGSSGFQEPLTSHFDKATPIFHNIFSDPVHDRLPQVVFVHIGHPRTTTSVVVRTPAGHSGGTPC
jgi:hypothetical protein